MGKKVFGFSAFILFLIILSLTSIAYLDSSLLRMSTAVFSTLATIGLTCLTYINVVNARKLVEESEQAKMLKVLPFLRVEIEQKKMGYEPVEIILRNVGNGPAIDIQFHFGPIKDGIEGKRHISCLGVGEKIDFDLGDISDYEEIEKINFKLHYYDLFATIHQKEGYVNLNEHRKRNLTLVRDFDDIAKVLEKIECQLGRMADSLQHLQHLK